MKQKKDFEVLEHTADIKIRVFGATFEDLFCNALCGMFQAAKPKTSLCKLINDRLVCSSLPCKRELKAEAPTLDILLVDFLSQALCLSDIYDEAYFDAQIHEFEQTRVKVTLLGVAIKGFEVVEIKAVTFHELDIKKIDGLWQTIIVFDI